MPAKKTARVQERRRVINRRARSTARTQFKQAVRTVNRAKQGAEQEGASESVKQAVSAMDRAARKGALHPNAAARHKSRLMRRLNKAASK